MTTAIQEARGRLEAYVAECVIRAQMGTPGPSLDGLVLRRLEDDLVSAVRFTETPF
jgi:hypothetical protein